MDSPLLKAYASIPAQGIKKIGTMIKLALKEIPRLQAALLDIKQQKKAREEILWILKTIGAEIDNDKKTRNIPPELYSEALYKNLSPQELAALNHAFKLIKEYEPILFKEEEKVKKLKNIFPKA